MSQFCLLRKKIRTCRWFSAYVSTGWQFCSSKFWALYNLQWISLLSYKLWKFYIIYYIIILIILFLNHYPVCHNQFKMSGSYKASCTLQSVWKVSNWPISAECEETWLAYCCCHLRIPRTTQAVRTAQPCGLLSRLYGWGQFFLGLLWCYTVNTVCYPSEFALHNFSSFKDKKHVFFSTIVL